VERLSARVSLDAVCLSIDVDWVPDAVLTHVVDLVAAAGVSATLFATHATPVLAGLGPPGFEVGLHPNFDRGDDLDSPLGELKTAFPQARGGRSHGLVVSSRMLQRYIAHGLRYESNVFLPGHEGLRPVTRFEKLVTIPFYWSDDKHLERGDPFELAAMRLEVPGLRVLNFHPIHVYMNTVSLAHYESFKAHYQDADALARRRSSFRPGIGTLFDEVLAELRRRGDGRLTLDRICERHLGGDA
jgi:hypothetical protein